LYMGKNQSWWVPVEGSKGVTEKGVWLDLNSPMRKGIFNGRKTEGTWKQVTRGGRGPKRESTRDTVEMSNPIFFRDPDDTRKENSFWENTRKVGGMNYNR